MKLTIKTKLILLIIVLILLVSLAFLITTRMTISKELKLRSYEELRYDSTNLLDTLDRFLSERKNDIKSMAASVMLEDIHDEKEIDELMEYFRGVEQSYKTYASFSIYDTDGIRVGDTRNLLIGVNHSSKRFITDALQGGVYHSSKPVISDCLKIPVIWFSAPIHDEEKNIVGVLTAKIPTTRISELFSKWSAESSGIPAAQRQIDLIDSNGDIILSNHRIEHSPIQRIAIDLIHTENSQSSENEDMNAVDEKEVLTVNYGGTEYLYAYSRQEGYMDFKGDDWILMMSIDTDAILMPAKREMKTITFATMIILLIGIVCALLFAIYITQPLKRLKQATEEVAKGKFETRVNIKTQDEFASLAESFNKTTAVLERLESEKKQIDRAKTEFLSITSHELRSPMTPMKAQMQMLMEDYYGKLNAKQKEALDIILRNTSRLDNIIVDLLEVSRIEAARLKFNFVKTDLTKHIKQLAESMRAFMTEKKVDVVTNISKLPVIECDPDRIMQVLRNLTNNAIKFSKQNSKVIITAANSKDKIIFSVKDSGIGISPEAQLKIFEPFYQTEKTMYRKYGGTGLGLTICRGIVESQNGKIMVESQLGKGTIFSFTIPHTPVKDIKPIKLFFSPQKRVEEEIREVFKDILGPIGDSEYEDLKVKELLSKRSLKLYIDSLARRNILDKEKVKAFKKALNNLVIK